MALASIIFFNDNLWCYASFRRSWARSHLLWPFRLLPSVPVWILFLGGLSLHLNHLIGSRMRISYHSFGMLSIGIFFSNLDSRQLMTCPRTLSGQIWNMSLFGDSRAVRVLMPKYRLFRKSIFSRWRSGHSFSRLGGFRWADGWAIWWYHFWGGGCETLGGSGGALNPKVLFFGGFSTHLWQLRGYSALTDFIKHQSRGAV